MLKSKAVFFSGGPPPPPLPPFILTPHAPFFHCASYRCAEGDNPQHHVNYTLFFPQQRRHLSQTSPKSISQGSRIALKLEGEKWPKLQLTDISKLILTACMHRYKPFHRNCQEQDATNQPSLKGALKDGLNI